VAGNGDSSDPEGGGETITEVLNHEGGHEEDEGTDASAEKDKTIYAAAAEKDETNNAATASEKGDREDREARGEGDNAGGDEASED